MKAWLAHHGHSLRIALQRLGASPLASLFTILVIGIAITLPAGLYVLLDNVRAAAGHRATQSEISVFLDQDASQEAAQRLSRELGQRPDILSAQFISREAALEQLRASGLGEVGAGLADNPLPHAVVVIPKTREAAALERLAAELRQRPEVDHVSLDSAWAQRLDALLKLGEQLIWGLAGLFGLALAAITGNTIRLQIYAQRDEIEVARLIGATDRFIRRPFLYFGALQGLLGGLAALAMLYAALALLQDGVTRLAMAYGSAFRLQGLAWDEAVLLLGIATALGLFGAHFAVLFTQRGLNLR